MLVFLFVFSCEDSNNVLLHNVGHSQTSPKCILNIHILIMYILV